jgi:hypothetical protein
MGIYYRAERVRKVDLDAAIVLLRAFPEIRGNLQAVEHAEALEHIIHEEHIGIAAIVVDPGVLAFINICPDLGGRAEAPVPGPAKGKDRPDKGGVDAP